MAAPASLSWMAAAFLVSFALAAVLLAVFGTGERAVGIALRVTARWCFLLFWLAYAGGAMAKLWAPRFDGLARRGREFGLAFGAALLPHLGLVVWLSYVATGASGSMAFFWAGALCTYLLALFSVPRLRDALPPRLWRTARTIALEYIALVFATDFILDPLHADGASGYPLSYLPFAVLLVAGTALRLAAFVRGQLISN
jgi:hypothetical protein